MGAIRGVRLAAEVKFELVGAILEAKKQKYTIAKACEVLMLDPRRLQRWMKDKDPDNLTAEDFVDEAPIAKVIPNKITDKERQVIIDAATDPNNSHLRHRKLAHHLSRKAKAYVSESTTLRVLQSVQLVCAFVSVRRPRAQKPEKATTAPNQIWGWDISWLKVNGAFWYLIAIIDLYSRKIVGYTVRPQATSDDVKDVFDKALANEGLLGMDSPMPASLSDRGSQQKSRSMRRFLSDLGIVQMFARPRTPNDNAEIESFFSTVKGERLYRASYSSAIEMIEDVDAFVPHYNEERLHQGVGFVTPAEKHDGRWVAIVEARREGMQRAQQQRRQINRGCSEDSDAA